MAQHHPVASLQSTENALHELLARLITSRCMIDVGAHHGTSLLPFLEAGWQVHAFEPVESNRRELARCAAGRESLFIYPEAVSDVTGTKPFHLMLNPDGSLHDYYHSLENIGDDPWHKKGTTLQMPIVCLDDVAAKGTIPSEVGFLKIDTEGHDLAVLRGAGTLSCEVISVEFWCDQHPLGSSPSPPQEMIKLLCDRCYESYVVISHCDDMTSFCNSSWEDVPADAWGNILFFRQDRRHILNEVVNHGQQVIRRSLLDLVKRNRMLQAACDERLQVIHELTQTAEERLQLIHRLDGMLKKSTSRGVA